MPADHRRRVAASTVITRDSPASSAALTSSSRLGARPSVTPGGMFCGSRSVYAAGRPARSSARSCRAQGAPQWRSFRALPLREQRYGPHRCTGPRFVVPDPRSRLVTRAADITADAGRLLAGLCTGCLGSTRRPAAGWVPPGECRRDPSVAAVPTSFRRRLPHATPARAAVATFTATLGSASDRTSGAYRRGRRLLLAGRNSMDRDQALATYSVQRRQT
jgi:hypothetical protein